MHGFFGSSSAQRFIASALQIADLIERDSEMKHIFAFITPDIKSEVEVFIYSIPSPVNPPYAVRLAIVRKFMDNLPRAASILGTLGYDGLNGCYYFTHAGMFHGVEPDGYIHT